MQLGGGLRCGVEFGARMLNAAYQREEAVISIDIANAFNSARHRHIWDGLLIVFPGVLGRRRGPTVTRAMRVVS